MPIKVGTLITELAKRVGIDPNTIAVPSDQFDLPDELGEAVKTRLFTEDAAKNNQSLKSYFFKQALDGVDENISRLMDDFELDEEGRNEIKGVKSTYERVTLLAKKIQSLEASKAGASKGDKAALQDQINKLNEEKANLVKERDSKIKEMQKKYEEDFTDSLKRNKIASANLLTEQFGKEVMEDLAYKYLNQELAAADAKAVQRNGVLKLVKASDEALEYYADNKAVEFNDFLDSVMAKYKLIAVTNTKPVTATGTPPINTQRTGENQARSANTSFAALLEKSKADLQRTTSA